MRLILILLAATLLTGCAGLCGAGGSPLPELTFRSPVVPGWTAPGTPVRAVPAWQGATYGAPQLAPQYAAPAATPCP